MQEQWMGELEDSLHLPKQRNNTSHDATQIADEIHYVLSVLLHEDHHLFGQRKRTESETIVSEGGGHAWVERSSFLLTG